jgi:hypothetical protein
MSLAELRRSETRRSPHSHSHNSAGSHLTLKATQRTFCNVTWPPYRYVPRKATSHHFQLISYKLSFYNFKFRAVNFVLYLGITNKYINSYQFIILLSRSYMFRQLCAIFRELVCTFWVTCPSGFLFDKILCSVWICVCYVAAWCVRAQPRQPYLFFMFCLPCSVSIFAVMEVTRCTVYPQFIQSLYRYMFRAC